MPPLSGVVAAAIAVVVARLLLRSGSSVVLRSGEQRPGAVPVSVIVPARNEAATLPSLLASLANGADPPRQVLVVDDGSTDATTAVARAHGAEVVPAGRLPAGWAGKPWACAVGARRAVAPVLVFLDADVRLSPGALGALVAEVTEHGGLVSVQPAHVTQRWYEQLSALFNAVAVLGSGMYAVAAPDRRPSAFGPCLATEAATYQRVGGHDTVAGAVVEDIALARRYRERGEPVTCLLGGSQVTFRMYPGGLRPLVQGWTKNIALGAGSGARWSVAATVVWVCCLAVVAGGLLTTPWALVTYAVVVVHVWWLLRRLGRFRVLTAALYPVPLAFFVVVFARSLLAVALGRPVSWKGRALATRRVSGSRP